MEIRPVTARELDEVVDIFAAAFYDSISFFTPLTPKIKVALKDFFQLLLLVFGPGFMAVSYTHLDVYKRQEANSNWPENVL